MLSSVTKPITIGILGGGQLGWLLDASVRRLARETGREIDSVVMSPLPNSTAEIGGARVFRGSLASVDDLTEFFAQVTHLVIENEFLDVPVLEEALRRAGTPRLLPSLTSLRLAQDKLKQKEIYREYLIPSAKFQALHTNSPLLDQILQFAAQEDGACLKTSRGGYDGTGNFALPPGEPPKLTALSEFLDRFRGRPLYIEKWVPYRFECALVACKTAQDFFHYPLVKTTQRAGTCEWVLPLEPALQARLEPEASKIAAKIAEVFGLEGVFAVEFFCGSDGHLLVNEIAPRVHNSGHYTLDAARVSQFEAHLRAVLELPLESSDFETAPSFAMMNLLGPTLARGLASRSKMKLELPATIREYWYGKHETRPMRKLGHWNAVSNEAGRSIAIAAELENHAEKFYRELMQQLTPEGKNV